MSSLQVVAVVVAKPGSEDVVGSALAALVPPTRREAGCVSYDLYSSNVEPGTWITIEEWRSQADLDAHLETTHMHEAMQTAGDHLADVPHIHPLTAVSEAG